MSWRRGYYCMAIFFVALIGLEGACRVSGIEGALAEAPIDIQTPNQLIIKLRQLQRFEGCKIVLLGDSLVYGGILKDFGDDDWHNHTLTPLLHEKFSAAYPGKKTLVMNLGINGALPADIECLSRLVVPCRPDLVILGTHLRHFSADFASEPTSMARPWLRDVHNEGNGSIHYRPVSSRSGCRLDDTAAAWLGDRLSLFRNRDTIQALIKHGSLPERLTDSRARWNGAGPIAFKSNVERDPMILLLQFKKRFSTVSLDDEHCQVKACRRTLAYLKNQGQKSIVFYVKENPDQVDSVIDEDDHQRLYAQLVGMIHESAGPHFRYVPPIADLPANEFLDLSHVNHAGYEIIARSLFRVCVSFFQD